MLSFSVMFFSQKNDKQIFLESLANGPTIESEEIAVRRGLSSN
jgi:hypothetical protein